VERLVPGRCIPEHVERPIWSDDRTRAVAVEDVARDQDGRTERRTAVGRRDERDRRLDVGAGLRIEDEPGPRDVDAVPEGTGRVTVDGDPFLVVERRGRRRGVDPGRRTPAQVATAVERALADLD